MKNINIILILMVSFILNGCYSKTPSYEFFKENKNIYLFSTDIPTRFYYKRESYNEYLYIYVFEHPKGCIYGYLTNRDDKTEVVQDWVILSGKEYCKDGRNWVLSF
ncbi:MAG: hypothetical protein RBQ81_09085 [Arcobacteraceae bacterium]|jgi:hypothetical protein|nr:hypothetical protein [Arcobacteraceae bacterium]